MQLFLIKTTFFLSFLFAFIPSKAETLTFTIHQLIQHLEFISPTRIESLIVRLENEDIAFVQQELEQLFFIPITKKPSLGQRLGEKLRLWKLGDKDLSGIGFGLLDNLNLPEDYPIKISRNNYDLVFKSRELLVKGLRNVMEYDAYKYLTQQTVLNDIRKIRENYEEVDTNSMISSIILIPKVGKQKPYNEQFLFTLALNVSNILASYYPETHTPFTYDIMKYLFPENSLPSH